MRNLVRRIAPKTLIRMRKRVRSHPRVMMSTEKRSLARISLESCDASNLRSTLNFPDILSSADSEQWGRVARRIDARGLSHNSGGVNPGDRRAISALLEFLRPKSVLEIGTHIGSSTLVIAATLAEQEAHITTVDVLDVNDPELRPWEKYGSEHSPEALVRGEAPVAFVRQSSLEFMSNTSQKFDFIFLDGDHSAATVYREMPLALQILAPGGVILIHDYFPGGQPLWPEGELILGPFLAMERFRREGAQISVAPLGELPWPTKLGSKRTSLALVLGISRDWGIGSGSHDQLS